MLLAACAEERPVDAPPGLPPHVTLLYPFVAETAVDAALLGRLERIASERPPVPFELRDTARFPGVLYVAPEPSDPFSDLIRSLWRAWPKHPPYGGAYATIVPHLTLIEGRPEPPDVERRMADLLPIRAEATEMHLVIPDGGTWQLVRRFPFGTSAAADDRPLTVVTRARRRRSTDEPRATRRSAERW